MADKGFTYSAHASIPVTASGSELLPAQLAGASPTFDAVSSAKYQMSPLSSGGQGIIASSTSAYMMALRGVTIKSSSAATYDFRAYDGVNSAKHGTTASETGGCEAKGRTNVSEPALLAMRQVDVAAAPIFDDVLESDEALSVNSAWSSCMAALLPSERVFQDFVDASLEMDTKIALVRSAGTPTAAQWSALEAQETALASAATQCNSNSGVDAYLSTEVADLWETFKQSNLQLLERAGGRTFAIGGSSCPPTVC